MALLGYLLCALAAFAASMPMSTMVFEEDQPVAGHGLLGILTLSMLVAPIVLLIEAARGQVRDAVAIGACSAALSVLVILRLGQVVRALQNQSQAFRRLTLQDPLTGLANRRGLEASLTKLFHQARRTAKPLSLVVLDLDHFKRFNDEYGHPAGDRLLTSASSAWASVVRDMDVLARIGGEEFVVVLPAAGADVAADVVERLRAATPLAQTFSAGIATWSDSTESAAELIQRADRAMYAAKNDGRDRYVIAENALIPWPTVSLRPHARSDVGEPG